MSENLRKHTFVSRWASLAVALILLTIVAILWRPVVALFSNPASVRTEVEALGPLAPVGFLALTVVQIVVAPLPGHPTQLLGGALFGVPVGSIYNIAGMTAGGLLATWLARKLGRPWLERQVDPDQLARYEGMARLESVWVWVIILLIPLGDFPYFLAGLSQIKLRRMALAILLSRGPFTVLVTWAGASAVVAPPWLILLLFATVLAIIALGYLFRRPLNAWMEQHLVHRLRN
ncbi:MAG: TVP38/TMEM64 family protein [Anaerolineae bacterium]